MNKIRGWLAMLEARSHDNAEHELSALKIRQKYNQLETALNVFKVSRGQRVVSFMLSLIWFVGNPKHDSCVDG